MSDTLRRRSKAKKAELPRDVRPFWAERGFRPDVAGLAPSANEDPKGEEAYQRAFYTSEESTPPRLPNPALYPNSPSAMNYVQKRSMDFIASTQGAKGSGEGASFPQSTGRRLRDPDASPTVDRKSISESSTSPASNYSVSTMPPPSSILSTPRVQGEYSSFQPQSLSEIPQSGPRLAVMEPFSAPAGPISKLR